MTSSSGTFLYGRSVKCIICMANSLLQLTLSSPSGEKFTNQFAELGRLLDLGPMAALIVNRHLRVAILQRLAVAFRRAHRHNRVFPAPDDLDRESFHAFEKMRERVTA